MYLSTNFTLEEMTHSQTASRLGINNEPDRKTIEALKRTCYGLEEVRKLLGNKPIKVSSGFRCEALERELTYSSYLERCKRKGIPVTDATWAAYFATKSHPSGQAVDFVCPSFGPPSSVVRAIVSSEILFDQVIWEFGEKGWVHVAFSDSPRLSALVIDSTGTRSYA